MRDDVDPAVAAGAELIGTTSDGRPLDIQVTGRRPGDAVVVVESADKAARDLG